MSFASAAVCRRLHDAPSHGENRGSSPLGSATPFAQSFTFKAVGTCLCKKDAVFV